MSKKHFWNFFCYNTCFRIFLCVAPHRPHNNHRSVDKKSRIQADDPLRFGQLMSANDMTDKEDVFDLTLKQAIGALSKKVSRLYLTKRAVLFFMGHA